MPAPKDNELSAPPPQSCILIYDPSSNPGGGLSRATELAAELNQFNYIFLTHTPLTEIYHGKLPAKWENICIQNALTPLKEHALFTTLENNTSSKIILKLCLIGFNILSTINKAFILTKSLWALNNRKIDLIHSNCGIHYLPYQLSKLKNTALVYAFRQMQYSNPQNIKINQKANMNVFVGDELKNYLMKIYNLSPQRCITNHSPFAAIARRNDEVCGDLAPILKAKKEGMKVIICLSRVVHEKGQHVVLEAFKELLKTHPKCILIIAGKAPKTIRHQEYLAQLNHTAKRSDIEDKVLFLGHRNDALSLLTLADISVQASLLFEPLAGVLVESMQLGILTISSDSGGAKEVIIPGETGHLYDKGDSRQLCSLLQHSLDNPEESAMLAAQGQKYATEKWAVEAITMKMASIYQQAIDEHSNNRR